MTDDTKIPFGEWLLQVVEALGNLAGTPRLHKLVKRQYYRGETPTTCANLIRGKSGLPIKIVSDT